MQDGIALTVKSFSHLAKDLPSTRLGDLIEQSKVEELLGGGQGKQSNNYLSHHGS